MSTHDLLKGRLATTRVDLEEVISRLSDELLPWAPAPGMRTVRGQLEEIGGTELQILGWVQDRRDLSYKEAVASLEPLTGLAELGAALRSIRSETLAWLDSLSETDLERPVAFPDGWFESLGLPEVPLHEGIRSIAQHEWYHVGQLVSYLWARGDDPYKWGL